MNVPMNSRVGSINFVCRLNIRGSETFLRMTGLSLGFSQSLYSTDHNRNGATATLAWTFPFVTVPPLASARVCLPQPSAVKDEDRFYNLLRFNMVY